MPIANVSVGDPSSINTRHHIHAAADDNLLSTGPGYAAPQLQVQLEHWTLPFNCLDKVGSRLWSLHICLEVVFTDLQGSKLCPVLVQRFSDFEQFRWKWIIKDSEIPEQTEIVLNGFTISQFVVTVNKLTVYTNTEHSNSPAEEVHTVESIYTIISNDRWRPLAIVCCVK